MGDEKKPWEIGKSFDQLRADRPCTRWTRSAFTKGAIWLKVNGQLKQNANLNQMIWSVAEQISKLSEAFELFPATSSIRARRKTSGRWCEATSSRCTSTACPT
jgi:2-keto-4-pentenoate hydratase/2-oxohepta-3-ene-1,7-dioic acid hydratase in catechol pathway